MEPTRLGSLVAARLIRHVRPTWNISSMWDFADSLGPRLNQLTRPPEASDIAESIAAEMSVVCRHQDQCSDDTRFFRAVYCISVSRATFDLFFNSWTGYRAAFFRSPYEGLAVNTVFIERLSPPLISAGSISDQPHIDAVDSLNATSAKLWLSEVGKELCQRCTGEWKALPSAPAEILNGRWETSDRPYAAYGRSAPYLTKVRIFGAFINERGDEFIPHSKRHRANELHECGWS